MSRIRHIGTISGSVGLKGYMRISGINKDLVALPVGSKVKIGYSENFSNDYLIRDWKNEGRDAVILLKGIDSPEEVSKFKEMGVFADEKLLEFDNEMLYLDEILGDEDVSGFRVKDAETGEIIGSIVDVWILPANDVWVVDTGKGEIPLPVIDDVVLNIDHEGKIAEVYMMPGLTDLINSGGTEDE